MRHLPRALALTTVAALTAAGLVASPVPADAAAKPTVAIAKIKNRTAPYGKKVTVEVPAVTTTGKVELRSDATFTIKRGKKTVAKRATAAKLKAGRYKVTTSVGYRTWEIVTKTRTEQQTVVLLPAFAEVPADCTVAAATAVVEGSGYAVSLDCTSSRFPGTQTLTGHADGHETDGWSIKADHSTDPAAVVAAPALVGLTFAPNVFFEQDLTETRDVDVSYEATVYSKTKTKSRTQNLVIKKGHRPSRTNPVSEYKCPSWAPIKGNAQSMIYHLPGQRFYNVTKPEDCFSTQKAAKKAGYRKSKV